jgi:hypothetical protein
VISPIIDHVRLLSTRHATGHWHLILVSYSPFHHVSAPSPGKTYLIFGTLNFIAFYFMYPETVGRSLEEVEEIFNQGHAFSAWKIRKDVGKKTFKEVVGVSLKFYIIRS